MLHSDFFEKRICKITFLFGFQNLLQNQGVFLVEAAISMESVEIIWALQLKWKVTMLLMYYWQSIILKFNVIT